MAGFLVLFAAAHAQPQTMGGGDCFLRRLPELDIGMEDLNLAPSGKHLL